MIGVFVATYIPCRSFENTVCVFDYRILWVNNISLLLKNHLLLRLEILHPVQGCVLVTQLIR